MQLLLTLCLLAIILFVCLLFLKIKKERSKNNDEVTCLICNEPLISSNYHICYKCRMKKNKAISEQESH